MGNSWTIARVSGIPISIHYSWLVIFALITWSLAADYFPMHHPGLAGAENWVLAAFASALFFASVLAHELAHSLVARAQGIPVAGITLFVLGGVSGLRGEAQRPRTELTVAAAGPLASLALAAAFAVAWQAALPWSMPLAAAAFYLAFGNLALAVFNLLPGFPLDGGRVLRAVVWWARRDALVATRVAILAGRVVATIIGLYGVALGLSASWPSGIWYVLIAWFLWSMGAEESARFELSGALRGQPVEPLVRSDVLTLDADKSLAAAAYEIVGGREQSAYPVLDRGELLGLLRKRDFAQIETERWPVVSVRWLARRAGLTETLHSGIGAADALRRLDELAADALPLVDASGHLDGLVERDALVRWADLVRQRRS